MKEGAKLTAAELTYTKAVRSLEAAQGALKNFEKHEAPAAVEAAKISLKAAQDSATHAADEYKELVAMYKADEFAEMTKELVLKRGRSRMALAERRLAQADQGIEAGQLRHRFDQALAPEDHIAFAERFGEINVNRFFRPVEGHPQIAEVLKEPDQKTNIGGGWHTDHSYDVEPALGSILYAREVPQTGGDTLFAGMGAAYDALSPRMQAFLADLTAVHDGEPEYRGRYADRGVDDTGKVYPKSVHPVIRTHPVTGRKSIYVNRIFTTRINDLAETESRALLDFLFEHCERPDFQCRFKWEEHSVAFWDNRCAQHLALWDYYPNVRSGYRVTVKGDRPV